MNVLERAIKIAVDAHEGQLDKVGKPYILHPMAVAATVEGGTLIQAAAVLHDTIEDCGMSQQRLFELGMPDIVIMAVDSVSRRKDETYRKYIVRCCKNPMGKAIKLADVMHNMVRGRQDLLPDKNEAKGLKRRYQKTLYYLEHREW